MQNPLITASRKTRRVRDVPDPPRSPPISTRESIRPLQADTCELHAGAPRRTPRVDQGALAVSTRPARRKGSRPFRSRMWRGERQKILRQLRPGEPRTPRPDQRTGNPMNFHDTPENCFSTGTLDPAKGFPCAQCSKHTPDEGRPPPWDAPGVAVRRGIRPVNPKRHETSATRLRRGAACSSSPKSGLRRRPA